jgi:hypothetical protein
VIPAPIIISIHERCIRRIPNFGLEIRLYLLILKIKFIKNKIIMISNQNALYTKILAASVPCMLSIKVPIPIAAEKVINHIAVSLLEIKSDITFLTIYWQNYILYYLD